MSHQDLRSAVRPEPDHLLQTLADYTLAIDKIKSRIAIETARLCLMDSLACAFMSLEYPACTKLLGPIVPGAEMKGSGARVPGTSFELDPVRAAWNIGAMIRWLDFNDTWLAAEWGHPSDNLGAILACADYRSRNEKVKLNLHDVFLAMIQAHEIQGVLALENGFNRVGLDHVLLVRIASTAVATRLLGGTREQIMNALSNAFIDGGALRTYRHAPNTGSRKSWAAGDATSRAVFHALTALKGEMGYPSALSTTQWGFESVLFRGNPIKIPTQGFGTYVMENVLFKISYPAEFHAQTAVEAAITLYPQVSKRLGEIEKIVIQTQESGKRIIDKTGPLNNPADRDHCIQYMVAVPLLKGDLKAEDYEDAVAQDSRIDELRSKMEVIEDKQFTRDYLDPQKRSIGNSVQVFFKDGSSTEKVTVEYPIGHPRRREEGTPLIRKKFEASLECFNADKRSKILNVFNNPSALDQMTVTDLMSLIAGE